MHRSSVTVLLIAIAIGGVAAYLARVWLSPASASQGTIVVAAAPLGFGARITAENVIEVAWETSKLPDGAFTTKRALLKDGNRDVLRPLARNEPVLSTKITAPGQRGSLSALLDEGKRAVTVRVDDVRGVAGFVLPGDRVDVVLIRSETAARSQGYSEIILQRVTVLAVDQLAGDRADHPTVAKAVTLEVTPEAAQKVLLAESVGKLSLILRESGEGSAEANRRVTEEDLARGNRMTLPANADADAAVVTVAIVRGTKSQDYTVIRDARR